VTTKRKRSSAAAPVTGVAAGNLGTAANLDDTQVLKTEDLNVATPGWLHDDAVDASPVAELHPDDRMMLSPAAAPAASKPAVEPVRPTALRTSSRQPTESLDRRRSLALAGAGALAMLLVLAGAGILSQLDLGSGETGGQPNVQAFEFTAEPPFTETPEPSAESGKGHGHDSCHGRHCN
jgi:hypothetical protein